MQEFHLKIGKKKFHHILQTILEAHPLEKENFNSNANFRTLKNLTVILLLKIHNDQNAQLQDSIRQMRGNNCQ